MLVSSTYASEVPAAGRRRATACDAGHNSVRSRVEIEVFGGSVNGTNPNATESNVGVAVAGRRARRVGAGFRPVGCQPVESRRRVCTAARPAPVAQRREHLTTDQKVRGSNPFGRAHVMSRDIGDTGVATCVTVSEPPAICRGLRVVVGVPGLFRRPRPPPRVPLRCCGSWVRQGGLGPQSHPARERDGDSAFCDGISPNASGDRRSGATIMRWSVCGAASGWSWSTWSTTRPSPTSGRSPATSTGAPPAGRKRSPRPAGDHSRRQDAPCDGHQGPGRVRLSGSGRTVRPGGRG